MCKWENVIQPIEENRAAAKEDQTTLGLWEQAEEEQDG